MFSLVILLGIMAAGYYATLAPVTIVVDGQARTINTNQRSVENILREVGAEIEEDDIVGPPLTAALTDEQSTIIVQHARLVTVQADGLPRPLPRTPRPDETAALIEAAAQDGPLGVRDRAMLEVLYGSRLRVSELVGLPLTALDARAGVVRVLGKGRKERLVASSTCRTSGRRRTAATPTSAGLPSATGKDGASGS